MKIYRTSFCSKVAKLDLTESFRKLDKAKEELKYNVKKDKLKYSTREHDSLDFIVKNKNSNKNIEEEGFDPIGYNKRKKFHKIQGAEENRYSLKKGKYDNYNNGKFFDFRVDEGVGKYKKLAEDIKNENNINDTQMINNMVNSTSMINNHNDEDSNKIINKKKIKTNEKEQDTLSDINDQYKINTTYVNFEYIFDLETISSIIANNSRTIYEILIDSGNSSSIVKRIINFANEKNIKIIFLPNDKLLRYSYNSPHNGLILKVDKILFNELKENILTDELKDVNVITLIDNIIDKIFISSLIRT